MFAMEPRAVYSRVWHILLNNYGVRRQAQRDAAFLTDTKIPLRFNGTTCTLSLKRWSNTSLPPLLMIPCQQCIMVEKLHLPGKICIQPGQIHGQIYCRPALDQRGVART